LLGVDVLSHLAEILAGLAVNRQMRSVLRNPQIASLFQRIDYIERMGTGILRIRDALATANCPDVQFKSDGFFTSVFTRPHTPQVSQTEQVGEQVGEGSSQYVDKILQLCQIPRTRREILATVGLAKAYN
jgi:ATP-dependent DNA helicase RecG